MTLLSSAGLFMLALLLALAAGALTGVKIGAQSMGGQLAAMMGAFFGPTAVVPAALVGLGVLYVLQ
jgi:hypothetical protein